jgi:hypothetical protein
MKIIKYFYNGKYWFAHRFISKGLEHTIRARTIRELKEKQQKILNKGQLIHYLLMIIIGFFMVTSISKANVYPVWYDNFSHNCDTIGLKEYGYLVYYRGEGAQNYQTWFQAGTPFIFPSKEFYYANNIQYVTSAYLSQTDSISDMDNWLVTPVISVGNEYIIRFRCRETSNNFFPDSLYLCYGTDSIPEGNWEHIANFKVTGSGRWVYKTFPIQSGHMRFAIRHKVVNGGSWGVNGNYVGLDNLEFKNIHDVNSDGSLDLSDMIEVYNDMGRAGYREADINLDEIVDAQDLLLIYNKLLY